MRWLHRRRGPGALAARGLKLHLGCGSVYLDGWLNIDLDARADLNLDVRLGLPLPDGAARLIYHEHLIEHLTVGEARRCLREWWRVLEPGGVMRVATPDLEYLIQRYAAEWRDQAWLALPEYRSIRTRAEMLNTAFRAWGHQYLYDGEELERRMREAGFSSLRRCEWGGSEVPELRGLETRDDSKLILEGLKP